MIVCLQMILHGGALRPSLPLRQCQCLEFIFVFLSLLFMFMCSPQQS